MFPETDLSAVDIGKVHAVRGRISRDMLRRKFGTIPEIPLGDPAIFADELPQIQKYIQDKQIKHRVVIVPHHEQVCNPYFRQLADEDGAVILSPATDRLTFLRSILSAEFVISQSLHGLIFAEVFGRPYVWIASQNNNRWMFKFRDWFSTTREPVEQPVLFGPDLKSLLAQARLAGLNIDREALRQALPRLQPVTLPTRIGFEACRRWSPFVFLIQKEIYCPPTIEVDDVIVVADGSEEADIRRYLHAFRKDTDDPFNCLLVFDQNFFASITIELLNKMTSVLDCNLHVAFVCALPSTLQNNTAAEAGICMNGRTVAAEDFHPHQKMQGVVLFRTTRPFEWNSRGVSVFPP